VHADVSTTNVLVDPRGEPAALIDFGLARWRDDDAIASSARGAFRGTLLYAAPEVARGEPFDARADLFALAASLLHVYSGVPPRSATTEATLLVEAGDREVAAWTRAASAGLSRALAGALASCLAFAADDRPRSAREIFA
jgi:serine/threonine-protein kinase